MSTPTPGYVFSASLRRDRQLRSVTDVLLAAESPKWIERALETHDLAIPPVASAIDLPGRDETFLFLILSPSDVGKPQTEQRVDRIWHLRGGSGVAVILLLEGADKVDGAQGMKAFAQLQIDLIDNLDLPVLPVASAKDLPATIKAFQGQRQNIVLGKPQSRPALNLLPFCSSDQVPLQEHTVNVLSDITPGFADFAQAISTQHGREKLASYVDDQECQKIIDFFLQGHNTG